MKNQIAKTWIEIAMLTNKQLTQPMVEVLLENVSDLPQAEVLCVLSKWLESEKQFPMPADVRQKIAPKIDGSDEVQEAVNRVIAAVSKFGYTNSENAKAFIGSLGWQIVTGTGGWKNLCENLTNENLQIHRAQLRDYGVTVYKRAMRGEIGEAPTLPKSDVILNLASNALKPI